MRGTFVKDTLQVLISEVGLDLSSSILAVCASDVERDLFADFNNVTISNLDDRITEGEDRFAPFDWSYQDAQSMTFGDRQFDFTFVSDGLHHCSSPHRALVEMYRVAKKGIIVFESRDSLLIRIANYFNLSSRYEVEAVAIHGLTHGGVNNSSIPNYIYRWTEREFEKVLRSYDPTGRHTFRYFYGLNLPYVHASVKKNPTRYVAVKLLAPITWFLTRFAKRQCNSFAMVALKPNVPGDLWPWLKVKDGAVQLNQEYMKERHKISSIPMT